MPKMTRRFSIGHGLQCTLGRDAGLALLFFILSHCFVQVFGYVAVLEYGAASVGMKEACLWDCLLYETIVTDGYDVESKSAGYTNWAFFPAFPLLASGVKALTGVSSEVALVLVSKACLLLGMFAFIRLVRDELGEEHRLVAVAVLGFNPYIIYAHAGYSEPLYFLLSTLAFLALRRGQWLLAGVVGGFLSATRLVGSSLVLAYLLTYWCLCGLRERHSWLAGLLGLFLIPLGLAFYMVYLYFYTGDALAFMHVQVAWGRRLSNPFSNLWIGLTGGGWSYWFAWNALIALLLSAWLVWRKRYGYAVFLLSATLIPLATGLASIPRYVVWQMPFLFALVELQAKSKVLAMVCMAYATGMAALVTLSWFAGKNFVT